MVSAASVDGCGRSVARFPAGAAELGADPAFWLPITRIKRLAESLGLEVWRGMGEVW